MSDYRSEYLRRRQVKERKEAASAKRQEANRLRKQMKLLSTGIALIGLALLVVIPIRFHAIAGDNMEVEQKYLMSNTSEEVLTAKSLMDARLATNDKGDVGQFAESILTTDDIDLVWTRETISTTNILMDANKAEEHGVTTIDAYDAADATVMGDISLGEESEELRLYEPVGESLYCVALLDSTRIDGNGQVVDTQIFYGDEPVQDGDGVLYDRETGVLYIPKDRGDKAPLWARVLVSCEQSEQNGATEETAETLPTANDENSAGTESEMPSGDNGETPGNTDPALPSGTDAQSPEEGIEEPSEEVADVPAEIVPDDAQIDDSLPVDSLSQEDAQETPYPMTVARIEAVDTKKNAAQVSVGTILGNYHYRLRRGKNDVVWISQLFNSNGGLARVSQTSKVARNTTTLESWGIKEFKVKRDGETYRVVASTATVRAAVENGLVPVVYDTKGKAKVLSTVKDVYDAGWCFSYAKEAEDIDGKRVEADQGLGAMSDPDPADIIKQSVNVQGTPLNTAQDLLNSFFNYQGSGAEQGFSPLADDEPSNGAKSPGVAVREMPTINNLDSTIATLRKGLPVGEKHKIPSVTAGAGKTTYKSSNTAVATVDSTGTVTAVAPGTAKITVNVAENTKFIGASWTLDVKVNKKTPTITATNKSVTMGATISIGATVTKGAGNISYATNNANIVKVDQSTGKVTPVNVGTATLTITTAATNAYNAATKQVSVTVTKGTAAITANNLTVQVGVPASVGATVTPGAGALKYATSDASIAAIDAKGTVTAKKAGHVTVTITAAENANWKAAKKTITVTVPVPPALSSSPVAQGNAKEYMEGQGGTLTVTDTVAYHYLTANTKYVVHEELVAKGGKVIATADKDLTPGKADGTISMNLTAKRSDAQGELSTKVTLRLGNRVVATTNGTQTIKPKKVTIDGTLELTTGGKTFAATDEGNVGLTAKVTYKNLIPKQAYEIRGTINGKNNTTDKGPITGVVTKKFTPNKTEGTETLNFSINTSAISSPALYATETLYQGDSLLATHKDPTNGNQTVTPKKPYIDATLKFQDGTREQNADTNGAKLTNSVTYNGLTANKDYEAHVTLHAKKGNSDGGIIPGTEVTIPIKAKEGENKLTIPIEGVTVTETTDVVAFTELREKGKTKVIASNANIADATQTVRINVPSLDKILVTSNGTQSVMAATRETTVTDQITYNDLTPGKTYEIIGVAQAMGEGNEGVVSEVSVAKTFVPTKSSGSETLSYDVALAGQGIGNILSTVQIREATSDKILSSQSDSSQGGITVGKPAITGTLTSEGMGQDIDVSPDMKGCPVTSTIGYKGLVPGQEYIAKSSIHAIKGGQDAGAVAGSEGTTAFTPAAQDGTVDIGMTINVASIESNMVTSVDEIWHDGQLVLANAATADSDAQTIRIHRPTIQASLATADGESIVKDTTAETVTLTDTIRYTDLTPGREYEASSELHMQDENGNDAGIVDGGKTTVKFVPQSPDGEVKVNITIALKDVMEKTLIAYEEIRSTVSASTTSAVGKSSSIISGADLAAKDGADAGSTVLVAQRKVVSDPSQAVTVEGKAKSPQGMMVSLAQTGDAVVIGVSTTAALGAAAYAIARHHRKNA